MRYHLAGVAAVASILTTGACGRRGDRPPSVADVTPLRTLPADSVFVLGATGDPPADTVVRIVPGQRHVVVLRHAPPDQTTFAEVEFGDSAFGASDAEVSFRAQPGSFGLDITSSQPIKDATITFKYARHFAAPAPARERYGTDAAFERQLAVGHMRQDGKIDLLPTRRPASDNVSAKLDGAGTYVVAGPK